MASPQIPSQPGETQRIGLALLGPFELLVDGERQRLPRKAQGLLAHLALQGGTPVPRDRLASLLWGKTAPEQARQSLRQSLAALRGALGSLADSSIQADGAYIGIPKDAPLTVDTFEFERLHATGTDQSIEAAISLYRGAFLADVAIPVQAFSDWQLLERQKFAALHSDLLYWSASRKLDAGDLPMAISAAKSLVLHDPLREEGHRTLIRALGDAGQRAAALKQYEDLKLMLREELGISPEAQTEELVRMLRERRQAPEPNRSQVVAASKAGGTAAEKQWSRPTVLPSQPEKPSIVVLPFKNLSGDPFQDSFVDGLVDDMTIALGREKWLFVISHASASVFRGKDEEISDIALKLSIRYVLRGSVRKSGERFRIVVLLSDATSGEFIWSEKFEGHGDNLFDMSDRLMTQVAAMIAPTLRTLEIERARRRPPSSLSAFELYLQSLPKLRMDLSENRAALQLLEQAIALDPSYSLAYGLAARCYHFQRHMGWIAPDDLSLQRGAGFARLAVELGQNDSEALWMAAHAMTHLTGEMDHAAEVIERSLSLNPHSASAWTSSCHIQNCMGRFDLAIEHFERSQRLNPLDHMHHLHWNIVGLSHFGAGRLTEADAAADKALQVSPAYPQAIRLKIATSGALKHKDAGRQYVQRLLAVHPRGSVEWLKAFYAPMRLKVPQLVDDFIDCSRAAGLPERDPGAAVSP